MVVNMLSKLLGERRLTQKELARMTGIRAATINEIYHDMAARYSVEQLDLICEALQCDISDLLVYKPSPIPQTLSTKKR